MSRSYILALDQGTTSSRAALFTREGELYGINSKPLTQIYPRPGWVEHDPMEIWSGQRDAAQELLTKSIDAPKHIAAIGVTNQRETTIVWDRSSGQPIHNAIVWQCRRTASQCEEMKRTSLTDTLRQKTGLIPDAYFSATKLQWILDNVPDARNRAKAGELLFGTVDTWLIWNLTGGKVHVTDCSNASRTMLYNINALSWDRELLDMFGIPLTMLPEVRSSSEIYGYTDPDIFGVEIPIGGIAGDQQAALFGQGCFETGMAKNTYGTGCFLLMNTGEKPVSSKSGLLTTIAWSLGGKVTYALEGSIFVTGAAVQWLRDELRLIDNAAETEALALSVPDTGGVYMVPAFVGLGAPYWDPNARGAVVGLTRGSSRAHLVRAVLESEAYQTRDVLTAMEADSGIELSTLRVDGGAVVNNFLMQFQSDVLGVPVERPKVTETTALGAAYLAGLGVGFWPSVQDIAQQWSRERLFEPYMPPQKANRIYQDWQEAVKRVL